MHSFTTFAGAEAALVSHLTVRARRGQPYSLEQVQRFLAAIGAPQDRTPAIHIAGTSGKTSTAYYAAAFLQTAGLRVGLLTSPHVRDLAERVQIDLQPLSEKEFCTELAQFMNLAEEHQANLTYPELLYSFGFWQFVRQRMDYMVIEVGLGGLLDPTNVMSREDKCCVITDIGLDHVNILGHTLPEIAGNKAGIIGFHNKVFAHQQDASVMQVIENVARAKQADLHILPAQPAAASQLAVARPPVPKLPRAFQKLPLFQQRNSYLALQAVEAVLHRAGYPVLTPVQLTMAAQVRIPGRMEIVQAHNKTIIFDGAHNAQKFKALIASIQQAYPDQPVAVLLAGLAGHGRTAAEMIQAVQPVAHSLVTTTLPSEPGAQWLSGDNFIPASASVSGARHVPQLTAALRTLLASPEPVLLVAGSFYLIQPAKEALAMLSKALLV